MIPEIFREHINERLAALPKGEHFIYFTDSHSGDTHASGGGKGVYTTFDRIEYIRSQIGDVKVVYGGDILGTEPDVASAKRYNARFLTDPDGFYPRFGKDALLNLGNHDANCCAQMYASRNMHGFNDKMKRKDLLLADTDIFETCMKPMTEAKEIVFDEAGIASIPAAVESLSYEFLAERYVDKLGFEEALPEAELRQYFIRELTALYKLRYSFTDDETKIKYIMPDCGSNGLMQFGALICGWTDIFKLQLQWLARELLTTPAGYDIVISSHMFGGNPKDNYDYLPEELMRWNTEQLMKIITAFRQGGKLTLTEAVADDDYHKLFKVLEHAIFETYGAELDFSARTKPGRILVLSGHWHIDKNFYITDECKAKFYEGESLSEGIAVAFVISDGVSVSMKQLTGEGIDSTAIDVVTFAEDGSIVFTRIGHGDGRRFEA